MGHGSPHTNCDHREWVKGLRVWVTCIRDKASNRGTWIALEPRIVLGVFTPDSRTKVGVVSNGELDGDNDALVMVETVQVGAERAVGVVTVVVRRGGAVTSTPVAIVIAVGRGEHRQPPASAPGPKWLATTDGRRQT